MKSTALITGASGGIGYELAKLFAEEGYDLVLVARSEDKLFQIKSELEGQYAIQVLPLRADLSQPHKPAEIFLQLQEKNIEVDVLVNNAGFGAYGPFTQIEWDKESQMLQLNIVALTYLTKLFAKRMVERKIGKILNVASTAAFQPGPLMAVYFASKSYVLSFSEALASELKESGITVTALCPGPTTTGFQETASMDESRLFKISRVSKDLKDSTPEERGIIPRFSEKEGFPNIVNFWKRGILKPASAEEVARFGFKALQKGDPVAVYGLTNKLLIFSTRFSPRKMVTALVRSMQESG